MAQAKPKGFALLSPAERKAMAIKGGKAVPAAKRAFSLSADLAKLAGAKGGKATPTKFASGTPHAKDAGRKGGLATGKVREESNG